jgi:hypothetical protein
MLRLNLSLQTPQKTPPRVKPRVAPEKHRCRVVHDATDSVMWVWRLERRADGKGPYQKHVIESRHYDKVVNPEPHNDFPNTIWREMSYEDRKKYIFGFCSEEAARNWFGADFLKGLYRKSEWVLRRVPAIKVIPSESGRQLIFVPHPSYKPLGS